ncbi:uncharacterized protein LOC129596141 [Paramacrobiotus metropolitanus]|uniref:uncharacterized protein LOC129596141 n=1 Tax=Paramacrobiotus metropolitanus TaxID=2943436 RepID=UPI002446220B|nr:uncharacterized protein LOC129596141 [Paramacrobiotus metropolitanus]
MRERYTMAFHGKKFTDFCEKLDATGILQPDAHFRYVCGLQLPRKYYDENRFEEGWQATQELIGIVRKIHPKYSSFRARLLMSEGMSAVTALHQRVLNGIN